MNNKKLILVYSQDGYTEMGGGIYIEYPINIKEMDERYNELLMHDHYGYKYKILCAGELNKKFSYIPVEKVIIYECRDLTI